MQEINKITLTRGGKRERSSNLELYRIICMLMIVAHHFVVNSGLTSAEGPMAMYPTAANALYLWLFGMWGKTGINCFLLITGYFMCKSSITLNKFIKLMLWIYIYKIIIFCIFLTIGYETFSIPRIVKLLMPVWGFNVNFTSCFIGFWLTIPFWNILINNLTQKQHQLLLVLLLGMYTILGSVPKFDVAMNYVTWFGVIYLIASYIRLYPNRLTENKRLFGWLTLVSIILACITAIGMQFFRHGGAQFFVSDSNKFFAVAVAVFSFLFFKNMNIPHNKLINILGGASFGVLLIHANSDAMRQWLWKDFVDCVGHYSLPLWQLICYSVGCILAIYAICATIDFLRLKCIEEPFFRWYDKKPRFVRLQDFLKEK